MKWFVVALGAAASGAIVAGSAVAAPAVPVAPPVYNWTGWYGGVNAGAGWADNDGIDNTVFSSTSYAPPINPAFRAAVAADFASLVPLNVDTGSKVGYFGGVQIGYNWQMAPSWLWGIEADYQWGDIHGDGSFANSLGTGLPPPVAANLDGTASQKIEWFGTLRGRLGWTPTPSVLLYATGGLAYGHVKTELGFSGSLSPIPTPNGGSTFISQSDALVGWTVGGGVEWMFAPRWSVKAEYLYYDLGDADLNQTLTLTLAGSPYEVLSIRSEAHYNGSIARAGLNYHF